MIRRIACALLLTPLPLLLAGCGGPPPMGTVSGMVTLDGKPLPDVEVQFLPDPEQDTRGATARCYTDEQGRFALRSERHQKDGALVGTHRVVFIDIAALPNPIGQAEPPKKNRVPSAYTDPNQTPFRAVEVKPGDQTLNFDLKAGRL